LNITELSLISYVKPIEKYLACEPGLGINGMGWAPLTA
jgi:hypothetical protein